MNGRKSLEQPGAGMNGLAQADVHQLAGEHMQAAGGAANGQVGQLRRTPVVRRPPGIKDFTEATIGDLSTAAAAEGEMQQNLQGLAEATPFPLRGREGHHQVEGSIGTITKQRPGGRCHWIQLL